MKPNYFSDDSFRFSDAISDKQGNIQQVNIIFKKLVKPYPILPILNNETVLDG